MRRLLAAVAVLATAAAAGCSQRAVEPLQLEEGTINVTNNTTDPWTGVEIWINQAFRATVPSIAAGARLQLPVNALVSGYGQRFDRSRMQITDVRLTAKTPDGQPVEHIMTFRQGGLEGAFGGKPLAEKP
jgi:hypothetical protein